MQLIFDSQIYCIEQPSRTILKHAVENIKTYVSFDFLSNVVSLLIKL